MKDTGQTEMGLANFNILKLKRFKTFLYKMEIWIMIKRKKIQGPLPEIPFPEKPPIKRA